MSSYHITVEAHFAAAHAIRLPDGSLETLHGHDWRVWVTVERAELDAIETVMDFHDLQALLETIIAPWRQQNLNDVPPFADGNINPTAERVAWYVADRLIDALPEAVTLVDVKVEEAPGCIAVYQI